VSAEGRVLCFLLALYVFAVLGYLTASLATLFIDVDRAARSTSLESLD
jgi:voltage-gated potassium channel